MVRAAKQDGDKNGGVGDRLGRIARTVTTFAVVATALGTLIGAANALWHFSVKQQAEHKEAQIRQLTTFGSFAELVKQHRKTIAPRTVEYVNALRKQQDPYTDERLEQLFARFGTGSAIYYSAELADFREIREFYDELGLQVIRGALDFDIVFELITFPSDFAARTAKLCAFVGKHWFGRDDGLGYMCDNSDYLWKRYTERRQPRKQ